MYLTAGIEIVLFPFFVSQPNRLPFAYHFPGLTLDVPLHWWLNFLDHFVLTITVVCAFSAFDSFVIMLILHGCCRIEITAHMVRNIQHQLQAPSSRIAQVLGKVVAHHVDTKRYVVDFNTQMGFVCLWEFVSASITVAMSLNVVASLEMSSVCLILTSASLQMLIYCYFGNILLVKSDELLNTAWEIDWYRMSCANQRVYCLFLMAAQLTLKVNAIFMAVKLETFVVVMRSSYQYFALLQKFS
jgi:7tm Odorant receptor